MSRSNEEEFIIKWYSMFFQPAYFIRRRLYESVRALAPKLGGKLLDFGCGSKPYIDLFTSATSYTGVDIEVSGHSHENEHIDIYYDGKHLPFEDNSYDNIFSTEVFEHVFNIDEILPEIYRVLKPGGQLLITCPFVCPEHEQPYDFARYTSFGIKHILQKHGFEVKEQIKTGNYFEAAAQVKMYFVNYYLPHKPYFLYLCFYQVFILPIILVTLVLNVILPKRMRRNNYYHSNVVLVQKPLR
jgi:ubiquinone/menaquinone biosynthesis C-methylase UbiE